MKNESSEALLMSQMKRSSGLDMKFSITKVDFSMEKFQIAMVDAGELSERACLLASSTLQVLAFRWKTRLFDVFVRMTFSEL